jgi:transcriptional regulator with XRE-family HTH domain
MYATLQASMLAIVEAGMHIGEALTRLRVQRGHDKQRDMARLLGWDASRVSRLENAAGEPDLRDVEQYLTALDPALASEFVAFVQERWQHVTKPTYLHPDRASLALAEKALSALSSFEQSEKFVPVLEGRAASLRSELLSSAALLASEQHEVVMIGRIAVGKTTALCYALDLLKPGAKTISDVVLHASGGRTTLCEGQVRPGDRFAIVVEPRPDTEVYRLAAEICESAANQVSGRSDEGALAVSKEIDKALRNMSGFQRMTPKIDRKTVTLDPIAEELRRGRSLQELISEFSQRLQLWKRTESVVVADPAEKEGRQWLAETSRDINLGKDSRFSLPQRVVLEVPRKELPEETQSLVFVDTKGIDDSTVRPDIKKRIDDPRSVIVLCTGFPEAPAPEALELLDLAVKTIGAKDVEARTLLLVLPQGNEALRIEDDHGNVPDDEEAAFAIRQIVISDTLSRHGAAGVSVHFFNAATGDRVALRRAIVEQVRTLRKRWCNRIEQLALGVEDLIDNAKNHHAAEVQRKVGGRVRRLIEREGKLQVVDEPLYQAVLEGIQVSSPRSICASTRRRGEWENFDVLFLIGRRAELQAMERSNSAVTSLQTILHEMSDDHAYQTGTRFLGEICDAAESAQRQFSKEARQIAEASYREPLSQADDLWAACDNRWGQGSGYRNDLEGYFRKWFKNQGPIREMIEVKMQRSWRRLFVQRILNLVAEEIDEETQSQN